MNKLYSKRSSTIYITLSALVFCLLLLADQISKYWAVHVLKGRSSISLIPDLFELYYLENHGAAWGILSGKTWLLMGIAGIVWIFLLYLYIKIPQTRHFILLRASLLLIGAGAVGNLIDRIAHRYVIDFFYFKWIDFPVFNIADIYVTVGAALLVIALFFVYSEQELTFWRF